MMLLPRAPQDKPSMAKIEIRGLLPEELSRQLVKRNQSAYRARQIYRWLYQARVTTFSAMTDLPATLRQLLEHDFSLTHLACTDTRRSRLDGTTKYLFKLADGNTIETVFLPEAKRATICLSSQVGCKYGCTFCASAPFGFKRNLHAAEIVEEVGAVMRAHPNTPVTNLVFMGIGEPLDNYANVLQAIRIMNHPDGFGIGARRITISTCGIIPAMERLAGEGLQLELSVSLHAADNETRTRLVPVNARYPLADLIAACKAYTRATKRIITFEYILIRDVNSSVEDARKLVRLVRGFDCKVNTISYNEVPPPVQHKAWRAAQSYRGPSAEAIRAFVTALKAGGIAVMHRKSKGADIDAGCGQLRIARLAE